MLYDFHTHTFLSDGVLSPVELVRRAVVNGYTAIAVTDHVGLGDQERVLEILVRECELASREMGIIAIPGVELTHLPPQNIAEAAARDDQGAGAAGDEPGGSGVSGCGHSGAPWDALPSGSAPGGGPGGVSRTHRSGGAQPNKRSRGPAGSRGRRRVGR